MLSLDCDIYFPWKFTYTYLAPSSFSDAYCTSLSQLFPCSPLYSFLQLIPLSLVWMLPDSKEEQKRMKEAGISNYNAGLTLAIVILLSLIGTIFVSVFLIWY
jgi:hypothetical protein